MSKTSEQTINVPSGSPPFVVALAQSVQRYVIQKFTGPVLQGEYSKTNLPDPVRFRRCHIFVPDESGGATMAFSDGTHWLRVQDRAIVS